MHLQYAAKKVMFHNCNYKATTELCSITTIRRTQNYSSYYRKLQCVLRKTTGASMQHYGTSSVEQTNYDLYCATSIVRSYTMLNILT